MGFEQRKRERQALAQHLLAQDWNVFGTLKFVNGQHHWQSERQQTPAQLLEQSGPRDLRQSR
ncbi:hypothetical protein [Lentibacter algarum]|uniref:hypothetical protein n=1 Tax=Lentibacter algarum TaxID=576131 RepID=UPI003AF8E2CE